MDAAAEHWYGADDEANVIDCGASDVLFAVHVGLSGASVFVHAIAWTRLY